MTGGEQPSNHRLDRSLAQQALDLIKKKYADFGPTLAHEKLWKVHRVQLSRESVRKMMIEEGVWKPRRAKKPTAHQMRERRACLGELVQIDGSDHAWFEERGPLYLAGVSSMMRPDSCWNCCLFRMRPFLPTVKLAALFRAVWQTGGLLQ